VGLGLNQLEDRLVQLASVTNGVAQITGELAGDREFLLQKLYVQILTDVSDEAFVRDPTEVLAPGTTSASDVFIGEVDVSADFIVVYRKAATYPVVDLWLEAPDGTVVRPSDAGTTFPNFLFVPGDGHVYFRCQFPAFPDRPGAHVGRWRVWLANAGGRTELTHGFDVSGGGGTFTYSVLAKARSDLRLGGYIAQAAYDPGSPMTLVLEPTLYGQPVALEPPVEARFTRPDGAIRVVSLSETEHGQYQATFSDTHQAGVYPMSTEVSATTPSGARVTRYRHLTGLIFRRGQPGRGGGEGGHDGEEPDGERLECREAKVILKRLRALLAECADERPENYEELMFLLRWLEAFVGRHCRAGGDAVGSDPELV
jgi:hypothetical protein